MRLISTRYMCIYQLLLFCFYLLVSTLHVRIHTIHLKPVFDVNRCRNYMCSKYSMHGYISILKPQLHCNFQRFASSVGCISFTGSPNWLKILYWIFVENLFFCCHSFLEVLTVVVSCNEECLLSLLISKTNFLEFGSYLTKGSYFFTHNFDYWKFY